MNALVSVLRRFINIAIPRLLLIRVSHLTKRAHGSVNVTGQALLRRVGGGEADTSVTRHLFQHVGNSLGVWLVPERQKHK